LNNEVAGEVLRPNLAALFLPQADQGFLVLAHNDAGIGAADEVAAVSMGSLWRLVTFAFSSMTISLLRDKSCATATCDNSTWL
jgi:hypothetical protein